MILPYIIPYRTPFKKFGLELTCSRHAGVFFFGLRVHYEGQVEFSLQAMSEPKALRTLEPKP